MNRIRTGKDNLILNWSIRERKWPIWNWVHLNGASILQSRHSSHLENNANARVGKPTGNLWCFQIRFVYFSRWSNRQIAWLKTAIWPRPIFSWVEYVFQNQKNSFKKLSRNCLIVYLRKSTLHMLFLC